MNEEVNFKKTYICSKCGCVFRMKFQDYDKCIECLAPEMTEISERLKYNKLESETNIKKFKENYNKNKKVPEISTKNKNKYFN